MCGNGHYSMKGVIEVVEQEEFDAWMVKQKPYYAQQFPDKDAAAPKAVADTAAKTASVKPVEAAKKAVAKM
ncbi:hypothetical protein D3C72_2576300 [compost metagenome]